LPNSNEKNRCKRTFGQVGKAEYLKEFYQLTAKDIVAAVKELNKVKQGTQYIQQASQEAKGMNVNYKSS
jgi:hypothetical protein